MIKIGDAVKSKKIGREGIVIGMENTTSLLKRWVVKFVEHIDESNITRIDIDHAIINAFSVFENDTARDMYPCWRGHIRNMEILKLLPDHDLEAIVPF